MQIGKNTKVMAVIGDPIAHSLSPLIQNEIIRSNGFDAVYLPFQIPGSNTAEFVEAAKLLKMAGFNATMPHKKNLLEVLDEVNEEAEAYGAVNTVKVEDDGHTVGYNTDVRGLLMAFEGQNIGVKGAKVMIIGAGGVAGALVKGLSAKGADSISVLNRTFEKGFELCKSENCAKAYHQDKDSMAKTASEADIIINCTSLGMSGTTSDFDDLTFLDSSKALVCDLIYNPWETKLISHAKKRGLPVMNGIAMLIYQGILAFEIMMDVKLDCHKEYKHLLPLCKEKMQEL